MPDFQTFIAILTTLFVFLTGILLNYDTIQLRNYRILIPQWFGLLAQGLLSRLWSWINSYGGLSDLKKSNAEMKKETEALRQQNARLAELESKLDIVLQSSDSNLIPTTFTDDN